ncbi:MAG: hypothetical protein M2R45_02238 [Verrucomicrobia subdivision 3 bacterium]|nr:hypothetical protein [Limisphaerales bacterium]MCS1413976.1 hypothetical protein [Limisphaerales bacterium]
MSGGAGESTKAESQKSADGFRLVFSIDCLIRSCEHLSGRLEPNASNQLLANVLGVEVEAMLAAERIQPLLAQAPARTSR